MTHRFPSPLLVIEASSSAGSIALVVGDRIVAERAVLMGPSRDDALLPALADILTDAHVQARDIRCIACGAGPGSFTSLRIAASMAKGIAVANDVPLYAIPSFWLAAAELIATPGEYLLHSDALRKERYVARLSISADGALHMSELVRMTPEDVVATAVNEHRIVIAIGAAANPEESAATLQPNARNILQLIALWDTFGPVSVALWEPAYGRLAEAQVKWEVTHGRALPA